MHHACLPIPTPPSPPSRTAPPHHPAHTARNTPPTAHPSVLWMGRIVTGITFGRATRWYADTLHFGGLWAADDSTPTSTYHRRLLCVYHFVSSYRMPAAMTFIPPPPTPCQWPMGSAWPYLQRDFVWRYRFSSSTVCPTFTTASMQAYRWTPTFCICGRVAAGLKTFAVGSHLDISFGEPVVLGWWRLPMPTTTTYWTSM